jgi:predicted RNase H-like nuclease
LSTSLIGIDCATQSKKIGLSLGHLDHNQVYVQKVMTGDQVDSIATTIAGWIRPQSPTLIAMDAPLGWPAALAHQLATHKAGEPIYTKRNETFRRLTDRVVREKTGKRPLDVGADRIARTAHTALELLHKLRSDTGQSIPLAWTPRLDPRPCVIEVYPAATLQVRGLVSSGYKGKDNQCIRQDILEELRAYVEFVNHALLDQIVGNDDLLDAAVCLLAAADFLRGECITPTDMDLAHKEGWIWVRSMDLSGK